MAEPAQDPWKIERLQSGHRRDSFDCGEPSLDEWLQRYAGQYERRDLARTYVAVVEGDPRVLGYYALSTHLVRYEALPEEHARGLPIIDIPVVLLGRLVVDRSFQGRGLGQHLLIDALRRAAHIAEHLGIRAVEVHALDDNARQFYLKFGFSPLLDDQHHLYLPMQVVRKLDLPPL